MPYRNSEEMNINFNSCFYADKHKPIHVCMYVVQKESTIELMSPKTHSNSEASVTTYLNILLLYSLLLNSLFFSGSSNV